LRLHGAGAEVAEMVVVGGGDGQLDLVHRRSSRAFLMRIRLTA
jgi:hypothetical protein